MKASGLASMIFLINQFNVRDQVIDLTSETQQSAACRIASILPFTHDFFPTTLLAVQKNLVILTFNIR
jgi:hypothetical protein